MLLCVLTGVIISSCEKGFDPVPDTFDSIIVFQEFGEKRLTLYNTGEDTSYEVTVFKSGKKPETTTQVGLRIMDANSLALYSEQIGRNYVALPASMYQLKSEKLDFSSSDRHKKGEVIFKTEQIDALLQTNPSTNYVLPIELFKINSKDSINEEKKLLLLKPNVVVPVINYSSNRASIDVPSNMDFTTYNFTLSLPFASPWDFECTVVPDPTGTLPTTNYSIENGGKVVFKKGRDVSEPLSVKLKHGDDPVLGSFTLPLKISEVSKIGIKKTEENFELRAIFNKIPLSLNMLSSNYPQEIGSSGDTKGVVALIDGDPQTYYHSRYSPSVGDAPHYFQIAMSEPITKVAFAYQNRNNSNGKPQEVKIWVSESGNDGSWKELAHITNGMPVAGASIYRSETYLSNNPFKYFRFEVLRTNGGNAPTFFSMAEFVLYGR